MKDIRILFLAPNWRVSLLRSFKKSTAIKIFMVGADSDSYSAALNVVDKSYVIPEFSEPKCVEKIQAICAKENIHAILPMTNKAIDFMDKNRAGFDEAKKAGMPVSTRAYGPIFGPREAAELGSNMLPHSAGIGRLITRNPPGPGDDRNEADLFSDMDNEKAEELIGLLVRQGVALDPTYRNSWLRYPADWERFAED